MKTWAWLITLSHLAFQVGIHLPFIAYGIVVWGGLILAILAAGRLVYVHGKEAVR